MAQRDQLAWVFGGHDACNAGHAQHIALFHGAVSARQQRLRRVHGDDAVGHSLPVVTGFALTSTITALPAASKWVRFFSFIFFHLDKALPFGRAGKAERLCLRGFSAMPKAAVGPVAFGAVQAQAALAQPGDVLGGDGVVRQQTGQQQVKKWCAWRTSRSRAGRTPAHRPDSSQGTWHPAAPVRHR